MLTYDKHVESVPKTHMDMARTFVTSAAMSLLRGGDAFCTSVLRFCAARCQSTSSRTGVRNAGSINQRLKFDKYAQRQHIFLSYYRYDVASSAKPF